MSFPGGGGGGGGEDATHYSACIILASKVDVTCLKFLLLTIYQSQMKMFGYTMAIATKLHSAPSKSPGVFVIVET